MGSGGSLWKVRDGAVCEEWQITCSCVGEDCHELHHGAWFERTGDFCCF